MRFENQYYEAFGESGPFIRPARTVAELEHSDRLPALRKAAVNLRLDHIQFGVQIWKTLGMTRREARVDGRAWLMCSGANLPLALVNEKKEFGDGAK